MAHSALLFRTVLSYSDYQLQVREAAMGAKLSSDPITPLSFLFQTNVITVMTAPVKVKVELCSKYLYRCLAYLRMIIDSFNHLAFGTASFK